MRVCHWSRDCAPNAPISSSGAHALPRALAIFKKEVANSWGWVQKGNQMHRGWS